MLPWFDFDIVFSVFSWFFVMMLLIYCDIVYLCSYGSSSRCIVLIVTVFICVLMVLLMLHWIDCDIVYLCSYDLSSYCLGLIVTLFICVLMVIPHFALDWMWHCLSVFSWFFLVLHWNDCDIVYLCSYGSSSCFIRLIVTLFSCVFMVLPHVALDWLWHCLSVFIRFSFMLHWINCDIAILCFHGSS